VNLTPGQVDRIGELIDQWSFLWDKRRSVWIAAEDCPDGEQVEDADLDILLARLPVVAADMLATCSLARRAGPPAAGLTRARAKGARRRWSATSGPRRRRLDSF
jgi:hypothetical protein